MNIIALILTIALYLPPLPMPPLPHMSPFHCARQQIMRCELTLKVGEA